MSTPADAGGDVSPDDPLDQLLRDCVKRNPGWRRGRPRLRTTEVVNEAWLRVARHPDYLGKPVEELARLVGSVVRSVLVDDHRYWSAESRKVRPDPLDTDPPASASEPLERLRARAA